MRQALRTSNTSQAQRREEILMSGTAVWHGGVRTSSSWTPFFFVDGRNILWVTDRQTDSSLGTGPRTPHDVLSRRSTRTSQAHR